jgi:Lrp/AsnC family leucine-responsive transcriptional regulator
MTNYILDKTDLEILNLLQKDGRLSHKQLAAMVNLSITPIHIRVRRLEEMGYIKRFTALLNPKKLGLGLIGYTQVILEKHTEENLTAFMENAAKLEEIMECYHMTGAFDFLLRIAIRDMEEYNQVLMKKLSKLPGVSHFESFFVMSEVKNETAFILGKNT